MNKFPDELEEIASFLNQKDNLPTVAGGDDSRRNSADSENKIIHLLQNQNIWKITAKNVGQGRNTFWCDFEIETKEFSTVYVDIKTTALETADNTNCMGAIYYILTGQEPPNNMSHITAKISRDKLFNDKDYYFLIVKKPTNRNGMFPNAFICSLKTLRKINSTGNNLPFQCKWSENTNPVWRDYHRAYSFILECYGKSLQKRAARYEEFKKYFPDINLDC